VEIFEKKDKLVKNSKLSENEIIELLQKILRKIHFINPDNLSEENVRQAYQPCLLAVFNSQPFYKPDVKTSTP